jgi:TPR repeat protein
MAAANSAEVEKLALGAGMKKGGAAKGELVLAMYELANCFRNGWGIKKDPAAAKHYYETAANLGDTDAMNEVAWCYTEGFGTKKDKFKAAQFLRLAESKGNKTLGNTWIWKDKYNPK